MKDSCHPVAALAASRVIALCLCLCLESAAAQAPLPAKQLVTIGQFQSGPYACYLDVEKTSDMSDADFERLFGEPASPGSLLDNYSFYVIVDRGTPNVKACDQSRDYLDSKRPNSGCTVPDDERARCPLPRASPPAHSIPLLQPLRTDLEYLIVINGIVPGKPLNVPLKIASSVAPRERGSRTQFEVLSNLALNAQKGQAISVTRGVARTGAASKESYPGHVTYVGTDAIQIDLEKPLPENKSGKIGVEGLSDYYGNKVAPTGTIQTSGAVPANVADAFVTTRISANAAVHQLPVYTAAGAVAPWHPAARRLAFWQDPACPPDINCGRIWFDPAVTFDVGQNSTQSANAITIPAPFSHAFIFGLPSGASTLPDGGIPPKPVSPLAVNLSFGPREEIDTRYGGVNAMGEVRAEFYLTSLSKSALVRKAAYASGNPAIRDLLELPSNGFSFAPYVQFDAGGRLTQQNLTSGTKSLVVPTYDIARGNLGIYGRVDYARFSLSLDASYMDLFSTETIGYVSKSALLFRKIGGLQPHSKLTFSTYMDQVKHYCVTLAWEDGRSAPSFQYLNTVSAGVQVTY
jgi:hypothetical protein